MNTPPSSSPTPAKRRTYRLNQREVRILESISELRVNLAEYQDHDPDDLARANWFAETHLDPLISDIADLKNGQPLKD